MKGTCWPRLSKQLTGPRDPRHCQCCGIAGSLEPRKDAMGLPLGHPSLYGWQEHDGNDQPEHVAVVLCQGCSDRLIEPHPRLYQRIPYWYPWAGLMGLCDGCKHRDGVDCKSPQAKSNGGEGIEIVHPRPHDVHFYRRGKGQRSGWEKFYVGPPSHCEGREAKGE